MPLVTPVQNLIFRFLQSRQKVQIWLYDQADLRIEGRIIVRRLCPPTPCSCRSYFLFCWAVLHVPSQFCSAHLLTPSPGSTTCQIGVCRYVCFPLSALFAWIAGF